VRLIQRKMLQREHSLQTRIKNGTRNYAREKNKRPVEEKKTRSSWAPIRIEAIKRGGMLN